MDKLVDVLIVGSGVSGLYSALNLDENLKILLICKESITCSNSHLAQGGICVLKDPSDEELFIKDTLAAGQYKNSLESVEILVRESKFNIDNLLNMGIQFDKDEHGTLDYTREGAHTVNRIVHVKDKTGECVTDGLIAEVKKRKNIEIYENTTLLDIIEKDRKCIGGIMIKNNTQINVYAKKVILATGGIGGLYKNSTNQRILKGDGIAIALKHDVELKDIKYIQIHPTAFYEEGDKRRLLISESLRGEGAILTNYNGERFVDELLPRDVVSKAVYEEMKKTGKPYVYLDISHKDSDYIKNRFSMIYEECLKRGCDITKEKIRVAPVQHFFMGGIKVDTYSRTSMKNLFAVGETSCTGVHGANRLASNSLLEGLVFSKRCAELINKSIDEEATIVQAYVENIKNKVNYIENNNMCLVRNEIIKEGGIIDDELPIAR